MRSAWRCLLALVLLLAAGTLTAQDHAQPRDKERREPPKSQPAPEAERGDSQRRHPPPEAAPQPAPGQPPGAQQDTRRRHPGPDPVVPRPPVARPDARDRHPRPDPDHAYRQRQYRWNDYQYEWWHGRRYPYYFPRHYDGPRWRMLFRGFYIYPHARLPFPDEYEGWFYWPFMDQPLRGCGWYRVPTRRYLESDPYYPGERWRYSRWRLVYLCFD